MAKFIAQFKDKGKAALNTAAEVGVAGGTMLVTAKFLDFKTLFKNRIAKDPNFANVWWIRHEGLWKFGGGIGLAIYAKNPWVRLIGIAIAIVGFVQEAIILTTDSKGTSIFNKIGANDATDEALLKAAENVSGNNPTREFPTSVGTNPTKEFPTNVGWGMDYDLMPTSISTVGGGAW